MDARLLVPVESGERGGERLKRVRVEIQAGQWLDAPPGEDQLGSHRNPRLLSWGRKQLAGRTQLKAFVGT